MVVAWTAGEGGDEGGGGEGGGDGCEDSDSPRKCMPPPVPGLVVWSLSAPAAAAPLHMARRALLSSQRRLPLVNGAIWRMLASFWLRGEVGFSAAAVAAKRASRVLSQNGCL